MVPLASRQDSEPAEVTMPPQPGGEDQPPTHEPLPRASLPTQPRCRRQPPDRLTAYASIRRMPSCCFHTASSGGPTKPFAAVAIWVHCQVPLKQPVVLPEQRASKRLPSLVRTATSRCALPLGSTQALADEAPTMPPQMTAGSQADQVPVTPPLLSPVQL